jgi:hypothetical protein
MAKYAATTTVTADKSRSEIEAALTRYGASAFAYGWQGERAMIEFAASNRRVRIVVPLPDRADKEFTMTPQRRTRSATEAQRMFDQAVRQRWRALLLVVKAKLEAVDAGIATFENEFLAYTVLPDGSTAGDWIRPQIEAAYGSGRMPEMLPALGPGGR